METTLAEVRDKLKKLANHLKNPRGSQYTYYFADYLAEQLRGEMIGPEEFLLKVSFAFKDLASGVDAITGEMIMHRAVDRVPTAEPFIRMDMPNIIDVIFPTDFAVEVKRVVEEVNQRAQSIIDKKAE